MRITRKFMKFMTIMLDRYAPQSMHCSKLPITFHAFCDLLLILSRRYSLMRKKTDKSISNLFVYKKFKKQIHFVTCILPGYVFNEIPKEFWKNSSFEI